MKILSILLIIFILGTAVVSAQDDTTQFYLGVDLSYVNEIDDCGAVYHVDGEARDVYDIFAEYGANLVRVRLWHNPTWTAYSTFDDVVRSLQRAKNYSMNTLLDFHYSDTWADPSKQIIPAAWVDIEDTATLGTVVYDYTFDVLMRLNEQGLLPDMVQVGNEINSEVMRPEGSSGYPINWERNAYLINSGIQAVRDVATETTSDIQVILHVAQPEEVEGWLRAAEQAGVIDFDIIGMSYYTGWSNHSIETAGNVINQLRYRFGKEVLVVETAYPWTFDAVSESAGNIPNNDFLLDDYPATPAGQRDFLINLNQSVLNAGGLGIVYWEPAWISTECRTLWGQGSHWENATFFDFRDNNEVHEGIEFLNHAYEYPVEVNLIVELEGDEHLLYLRGDFTGMGRRLLQITSNESGQYILNTRLMPDTEIQYQFYTELPASEESALLVGNCVSEDGMVTVTIPENSVDIHHEKGACPVVGS